MSFDFPTAASVLGGGMAITGLLLRKWRMRGSAPEILDTPLFWLSPHDPFTVRSFLPGTWVAGASGSGKSSSSMRKIIAALLGLKLPDGRWACGGIWHGAKPEDKDDAIELVRALGREDDLVIFEPGNSWRMNVIGCVVQQGGTAQDITRVFMTFGESLGRGESEGRKGEQFWEKANEMWFYNAVVIQLAAYGTVDVSNLQKFRTSMARVPEDLSDAKWKAGFQNQSLGMAYQRGSSMAPDLQRDISNAADYFLSLPQTDNRTLSGILAGVDQLLFVLNTGRVYQLCSTTTNIRPEDTFDGKFIFVNMPPTVDGDEGNCVNAGIKYVMQRAVLRRKVVPGDRINVIIADEFPNFFNRFDSRYVAEARSHLGGMLVAAQGRDSFYAALKTEAGKHETNQFLAQMRYKIFHALGTPDDARYASGLCDKQLVDKMGLHIAPPQGVFDAVAGLGSVSSNVNEEVRERVLPSEFLTGLRTGGPPDFVCDSIVVKSGESFSTGEPYLRVRWSQR